MASPFLILTMMMSSKVLLFSIFNHNTLCFPYSTIFWILCFVLGPRHCTDQSPMTCKMGKAAGRCNDNTAYWKQYMGNFCRESCNLCQRSGNEAGEHNVYSILSHLIGLLTKISQCAMQQGNLFKNVLHLIYLCISIYIYI